MPFVPLRGRTKLNVVLDDDKDRIIGAQRAKDSRTVASHFGEMPGSRGYRYANHPITKGEVRGPDPPFTGATNTWRPPSADPQGPSAQRVESQAEYGAHLEGSHGHYAPRRMASIRSLPNLQQAGECCVSQDSLAIHPLQYELKRWEGIAKKTQAIEMKDHIELSSLKRSQYVPKQESVNTGGLINFPKYMLIHNCHLKQMDCQRFKDEQDEERRNFASMAEAGTTQESFRNNAELGKSSLNWQTASWGAPMVKDKADNRPLYAGSAMPAGRGSRTSNPFRMG